MRPSLWDVCFSHSNVCAVRKDAKVGKRQSFEQQGFCCVMGMLSSCTCMYPVDDADCKMKDFFCVSIFLF